MQHTQWHLLTKIRFLPLFLTQFFGAFNDNLFKGAITILVTYKYAQMLGIAENTLVAMTAGFFVLPMFLFSATAGIIADNKEKSNIIRKIKFIEIILMAIGAIAFYQDNYWFLLGILFLMGAQSTFFGPIKYSIIPYHLQEDELIGGNALIEAGTFIAILLGTIIGAMLIRNDNGIIIISALVIVVAIVGYIASRFIPESNPHAHDLKVSANFIKDTFSIIKYCAIHGKLLLIIICISWFWFVGATYLSQFPNMAKIIFRGDESLFTIFLLTFTIGIGIGSLVCNKLLKGKVKATYVPFAALGMAVFSVDVYFAINNIIPINQAEFDLNLFFQDLKNLRVLADLILIAVSGGIYIVPLYAMLQKYTPEGFKARAIASNNILNSCFMVLSAVTIIMLTEYGLSISQIFLTLAIACFAMAKFSCNLLSIN